MKTKCCKPGGFSGGCAKRVAGSSASLFFFVVFFSADKEEKGREEKREKKKAPNISIHPTTIVRLLHSLHLHRLTQCL